MAGVTNDRDDQDQSETFDETHIDDEGDGDVMLEETGPVLDVTREDGDGLEDEPDDGDDRPGFRADPDVVGTTARRPSRDDGNEGNRSSPDEVELVYSGLMREARGAQASAAHWESRRLADDDIAGLGYGPDAETAATANAGER